MKKKLELSHLKIQSFITNKEIRGGQPSGNCESGLCPPDKYEESEVTCSGWSTEAVCESQQFGCF